MFFEGKACFSTTLFWWCGWRTAWWWLSPASHETRTTGVSAAIHGFLFFMFVNGAVVFADGWMRVIGIIAVGTVSLAWSTKLFAGRGTVAGRRFYWLDRAGRRRPGDGRHTAGSNTGSGPHHRTADPRSRCCRIAYAQINLIATLLGALFAFGVGSLIDRRGSRPC